MSAFSLEKGSLAETSILCLVAAAQLSQVTGVLVLQRDRVQKRILFHRGALAGAASNQLSESLGRLLVAWGYVSRDKYMASLDRMDSGKERHGDILVSMGALSADAIPEALYRQSCTRLVDALSWTAGQYHLEPGDIPAPQRAFPTWQLFQDGIYRRHGQAGLTAEARNARTTVPTRKEAFLESFLYTYPEPLAIYNQVDGSRTVAQLATDAKQPLVFFTHIKALEELGLIELAASGSDPLEQIFQRVQRLSPSDLLGVRAGSGSMEIAQAVQKLRNRYSAAKYAGSQFVQPLIALVEESGEMLRRQLGVTAGQEAMSPQAEREFQLGRDYLKKRQPAFARQKFEEALFHAPQSLEIRGYLAWTTLLEKPLDESSRRKAAEELRLSFTENTDDPDLFAFYGAVLKLLGRLEESESALTKALELDPEHEFAQRELASVEMRLGTPQDKSLQVKSIQFDAPIVIERWIGGHSVVVNFQKDEIRIGSGEKDDLAVSSEILPQVLPSHCSITLRKGRHFVRRNGSGGTVSVDGRLLNVREDTEVIAANRVVLGSTEEGPTLEFRVLDQVFLQILADKMATRNETDFWRG